tara:strand:+ start:2173 stop:3078 length:906 start_codon:yes stop_codon:yes gene_type:complete
MILVCGDIILDEVKEFNSNKISPEAPLPILILNKKKFFLGGAGNVANNIKKLSRKIFLISSIGKDSQGEMIKKLLSKNKIKNKLIEDSYYKTTHKSRGHLNNRLIFRIDNEKPKNLKFLHKQLILKFIKKNIKKFNLIVISDYNKGFFDKYFIKQVSLIFKKANKLIITNPKRKNVSFYDYSNILVPNEKEFKNFFTKKNTLIKMSDLVFDKVKSLKYLIITRGHKNLILSSRDNKIKYLKVNKVISTDVTGASDTFLATLSVYLDKNLDILYAIKKAIKASKKVVTKKYTSVIKLKEIER